MHACMHRKKKQTSKEILQPVELVDDGIRVAMAIELLLAMINLSQATHLFLPRNAKERLDHKIAIALDATALAVSAVLT